MIVVCSDTHGRDGSALSGRTLEAVRRAELVIHAGDFTTPAVLDAFRDAADRLVAVHGNADEPAVRDRLPEVATVEHGGVRFVVTHRRDGGQTALSLLGRQYAAVVVVSGHTHRPSVTDAGAVTLLNPGSHVEPRGNRAAHAELEARGDVLHGRLRAPDGSAFETFEIDR